MHALDQVALCGHRIAPAALAVTHGKGEQIGVFLDRVGMAEGLKTGARVGEPGRRGKRLFEKALETSVLDPADRFGISRWHLSRRTDLRDQRGAERQAGEGPCLLEAAAVIKMAIEDGLGLGDEVIPLRAIQRTVKHRDVQATGFDPIDPVLTARIDAAEKQQIDRPRFERNRRRFEIGRVLERHQRHIARIV